MSMFGEIKRIIHMQNIQSNFSSEFNHSAGAAYGGSISPSQTTNAQNNLSGSFESLTPFVRIPIPVQTPVSNPTPVDTSVKPLYAKGGTDADEIDINDVKQGHHPDCFFLASTMAIAKANPQAIRDRIKDNHNGTYDVTLFNPVRNTWDTTTVTQEMLADPKLSINPSDSPNREGEIWVQVLEAAFIKHYPFKLEDGGPIEVAFKILMGPLQPSITMPFVKVAEASVIEQLTDPRNFGRKELQNIQFLFLQTLVTSNQGLCFSTNTDFKVDATTGLLEHHVYMVSDMKYDSNSQKWLVRLQNPHGPNKDPTSTGQNYGWIDLADVVNRGVIQIASFSSTMTLPSFTNWPSSPTEGVPPLPFVEYKDGIPVPILPPTPPLPTVPGVPTPPAPPIPEQPNPTEPPPAPPDPAKASNPLDPFGWFG
jgi:hypothetical protein